MTLREKVLKATLEISDKYHLEDEVLAALDEVVHAAFDEHEATQREEMVKELTDLTAFVAKLRARIDKEAPPCT